MSDHQASANRGGFDPDSLRSLYQTLNASRIDWSRRKWDTLRLMVLIASASIAGLGGLALTDGMTPRLQFGLGMVFVIEGVVLAWWTYQNVKRETAHQMRDFYAMVQVEKLLGLHAVIPEGLRVRSGLSHIFTLDRRRAPQGRNAADTLGPDPLEEWVSERVDDGSFVSHVGLLGIFVVFLLSAVGVVLMVLSMMSGREDR